MPKAKVTRDMVVEAAFAVARAAGAEQVNARTVSEKLGCSTQPVMYHFATIEALKRAVYAKADRYHSDYLMETEDLPLGIGLNYIRFAIEELHLFRFLFQSGFAVEGSLPEMLDSAELEPILSAMQGVLGLGAGQTKEVFLTVALFTHGYASIIANNRLEFDEAAVSKHLERVWEGAVLAAQEEMK
ncbi:MAG: WHG domain-containing protein [Oscillospiraceae bacterium]|jgi:AcrR family transcriptional regulator|nr:WHG domain-containing protein [Oscillospiraceae bacterium]MCI8721968.1 WHG domain-containing protein [Oscillospiraceae bacterium]